MSADSLPEVPPLPDLHQAQLDSAGLETLLRDIAACGRITGVIPKYRAAGHVPDHAEVTVDEGHRLLINGEARAVQFRYHYEDGDWWDTVMALPGGLFRLVRIQHHFDPPSA